MGKYKLYGGNADWDFIRKLASDKLGAEFEWVKRSRAAEQAKRMSDVEAVEVIAEALAKHHAVGMGICNCGWSTETKLGHSWREKHEAHQASVIAALPNIAIVEGDVSTEYLCCGHAGWPDPLSLQTEERALAWLEEHRGGKTYLPSETIRVVRKVSVRKLIATEHDRAAGGES